VLARTGSAFIAAAAGTVTWFEALVTEDGCGVGVGQETDQRLTRLW
jgi:hypothetical protein